MTEIGRVPGYPDPRIAQYQPKAADAKPAEQGQDITKQKIEIPPYETLGKKPNLDNGGKNLECWSDLRSWNLERKKFKQDNLSEKLRNADLRDKYDVLVTCVFDNNTPWPPPEKLPPNFDPKKILEKGMDPGLGIRDLQKYGIIINGKWIKLDGADIRAAIIDAPLPKRNEEQYQHEECKGKVKDYNEVNPTKEGIKMGWWDFSMHGPAVSSIFGGNKCGVAPEAKLHYWADVESDVKSYVDALEQIMDYNDKHPDDPIKVVSISKGFRAEDEGFALWESTLKKAKDKKLIVIHSGSNYYGLGCPLDKNINTAENYDVCYFKQYPEDKKQVSEYKKSISGSKRIGIPIDNRSFADFYETSKGASFENRVKGTKDYVFGAGGGFSWASPYLAGVMVLGFQVEKELNKVYKINGKLEEDDIYTYLWETSTPVEKKEKDENGKVYTYTIHVINPKKFIDRVRFELEKKKTGLINPSK